MRETVCDRGKAKAGKRNKVRTNGNRRPDAHGVLGGKRRQLQETLSPEEPLRRFKAGGQTEALYKS